MAISQLTTSSPAASRHGWLASLTSSVPTSRCRSPIIGYGLWRSGRPCQSAASLDLARLSRFIHGYATAVGLRPHAARALPVYLYGRGLQMIAKRVQAGRAETWPLAQVQWTAAHATAIADTAAAPLP